ncbi:MAG: ribosome maturation factor RimP [Deltaproteobacteria bacterium]|jgi:ribosome maturation factor RimP|nr:ribosome maturation factor RimP [Deltaproteobacteria bacterium]
MPTFLFYMPEKERLEDKLTELLQPVIINSGYELVDLAIVKAPGGITLRILLDKPEGVTLADCERISRLAGDILDAHDPISSHYILEVSSPGINRPLKKQADFQRFAGQKALVETKIPISGRKRYKGLLLGVENGNVIISVDGADHCIPIEQIRKARLDIL